MPSRFNEYKKILSDALKSNYSIISIIEYYKKLENDELKGRKFLILRHDIDTDINTAKRFFEIEKKYNVTASYYFRLSTLDFSFMKEIIKSGSEVGYHFEEIADYCKQHKIHNIDIINRDLDKIKELFIKNFISIEEKLESKIYTIASHGDFINRKLNIKNNVLTDDFLLREKCKIECEAYDKNLFNSFDIYISDKPYPIHYYPMKVSDALGKYNVICMLSHPRQWKANCFINLKENFIRVIQELFWV
jgi:hypothetical protein